VAGLILYDDAVPALKSLLRCSRFQVIGQTRLCATATMHLLKSLALASGLWTSLSLALAVTQSSGDLTTPSACTCPSGNAPNVTVMRTVTNTQTIYNTTSSVTAYQVVLLNGGGTVTTTTSRGPSSTTTVTQTLHSTA